MNGKLIIVSVIFFGACSADAEHESQKAALTHGTGSEISIEIENREKAKSASPAGPYLESIDATELVNFPIGDITQIPKDERSKLARIDLPVLGPSDASLWNDALITHKQHWYALATRTDRIDFYIKGTRLAFDVELDIPHPPTEEINISRSHGIVTASFRKFNVSYNMDIECRTPESDPYCVDDDKVRSLVRDLVLYQPSDSNGGVR